jgi:hypothetical protein
MQDGGSRRKLFHDCLDQPRKTDTLGGFHHDRVARAHFLEHKRLEIVRACPIFYRQFASASASASAFISGPARKTLSGENPAPAGQVGMQLRRMFAEFQHVAKHGDAPPSSSGTGALQQPAKPPIEAGLAL